MTETNCGFWLEGKFVLRVRGLRRFINNLMDEADCGFWLKGGFVLRLEELRRFVGGLAAGADCSFSLGRVDVATIWASMRGIVVLGTWASCEVVFGIDGIFGRSDLRRGIEGFREVGCEIREISGFLDWVR